MVGYEDRREISDLIRLIRHSDSFSSYEVGNSGELQKQISTVNHWAYSEIARIINRGEHG